MTKKIKKFSGAAFRTRKEKRRIAREGLHSHGGGPGPGVLRPAGVGGVAVGGDVIGLAGGSGVGHIGDVGTAVFSNQIGVLTPLEGKHGLVTAVGLFLIDDDLAGSQFPHGSSSGYIEFDSQGSTAGFRSGNAGSVKKATSPSTGRECHAEYQG